MDRCKVAAEEVRDRFKGRECTGGGGGRGRYNSFRQSRFCPIRLVSLSTNTIRKGRGTGRYWLKVSQVPI